MSLRIPAAEYKALCLRVCERDNWKCRNHRCGMRNPLHIHHIIFRSDLGPDESWNLIAVCNECHMKLHRNTLSIVCATGNFVGQGGGADGKVIFWEESNV